MQQFGVERFVERITVIGERQFEEVSGREQFKERDEGTVVVGIGISQWCFILAQVEPDEREFTCNSGDGRFCNFPVEEISCFPAHSSRFKVGELLHQRFVSGEQFFEQVSIKNEPLVNIGSHEVFEVQVFVY